MSKELYSLDASEIKLGQLESYEVLREVRDITEAGVSTGISPQHIVHIGGIAVVVHTCRASGQASYSINWRGTEDVDIAVTTQNGPERLSGALQARGVVVHHQGKSWSIEDKYSVETNRSSVKGAFRFDRKLEIDLYGPDNKGQVKINDRKIYGYPDVFILDQVEFGNSNCTGELTVPSLADTLILKLDILANQTIRPKDLVDISSLLYSAEQYGQSAEAVVARVKCAYPARYILDNTWEKRICPGILGIIRQRNNYRKLGFVPVATDGFLDQVSAQLHEKKPTRRKIA